METGKFVSRDDLFNNLKFKIICTESCYDHAGDSGAIFNNANEVFKRVKEEIDEYAGSDSEIEITINHKKGTFCRGKVR